MEYIDVLIPLLAGVIFVAIPNILITTKDATYEKKKIILRKCGYVLIIIAVFYLVINLFKQ